MLRTTSGNATYVCDSWGTCLNYQKGSSYEPKSSGLLWQAIYAVGRERSEQGHGIIDIVWIESHLSHDEARAQGYPKLHWVVNKYADDLASRAAE